MSQGAFNFKYVESKNNSGMTAYAGLGVYFDLLKRLDFVNLVNRCVSVSGVDQGWADWQNLLSLILLNLCGGNCVDDISSLSSDEGLCRLFSRFESSLSVREQKVLKKRWRKGKGKGKGRHGAFPSSSALLRYLKRFDGGKKSEVSGEVERMFRNGHRVFVV